MAGVRGRKHRGTGGKEKGKQREKRLDGEDEEKEMGRQEEDNKMKSMEEGNGSFSLVAYSVGTGA